MAGFLPRFINYSANLLIISQNLSNFAPVFGSALFRLFSCLRINASPRADILIKMTPSKINYYINTVLLYGLVYRSAETGKPLACKHDTALFVRDFRLSIYLGKVKILGVSLGVTFVLFVGIILGHFGYGVESNTLHFYENSV